MKSVTLSEGLEDIGYCSFNGCSGLTDITIPASVKRIEAFAFDDCDKLKEVYYKGDLSKWCSIDIDAVSANPCCNGANLYFNGTKVNEKTFLEWKRKRDEFRKQEEAEKIEEEKKLHEKSKLTGVQLFKKQAELFKDDEDAQDLKEEQEKEKIEREKEGGEVGPDKDQIMKGVIDKDKDKEEEDEKEVKDVQEGIKDVKINEDLFKEDANLDELDDMEDEDKKEDEKEEDKKEDDKEEDKKEEEKEEDEKDE